MSCVSKLKNKAIETGIILSILRIDTKKMGRILKKGPDIIVSSI